ncbi:MAG: LytTR family DNA-binding domain-containing protein, partial [Saprospiraceae bacterium]
MKAVIIEDEELIAKLLIDKIKKVAPDIEILTIISSLKRARKWFSENAEPDLLFMDIQLSDGVSFDIFDDFKLNCPVIFTTAYDEYALKAFKTNGIDYILKPVKDDELNEAILKCKKITKRNIYEYSNLNSLIASFTNPENIYKYKEKFIGNFRNQWIPIRTKDIACFFKEVVNYAILFNGEKYSLDFQSLEDVEEFLDPKQFYRANRQYIINLDAIQSVKPIENSKLIIRLREPNHKIEIDTSR